MYSPPLSQPRIFFCFPCQFYIPSAYAAAATVFLAPVRSIPACSHHHIPTITSDPGVLSVPSHRCRSDCVAMNCATMLCLLQMYSSISSNPTSFLAAAVEVYSHFPYDRRCGSPSDKHHTTWSYNPPRTRPIWGVTTNISLPKSSNNWNTALRKNRYTRDANPSLLRILVNLRHTVCAFSRFLTTAGQFSPTTEITLHKYLNEVTSSRVNPYELKVLYVTTLYPSAPRRCCLCFYPFLHFAVRRCILFKYHHGASMLHIGNQGWGRFPSSSKTTVSWTCWCQKCTHMAVCVTTWPLYPSTGQVLGPAFSGNVIQNFLGFSPPPPSLSICPTTSLAMPCWVWQCAASDPLDKYLPHYRHFTRFRCLSY